MVKEEGRFTIGAGSWTKVPSVYDALGFRELKDLSNTSYFCSPCLASMSMNYIALSSAFRLMILNHIFGKAIWGLSSLKYCSMLGSHLQHPCLPFSIKEELIASFLLGKTWLLESSLFPLHCFRQRAQSEQRHERWSSLVLSKRV